MIGFWATLSLNMPDFTRFGRSQREQVVGQVVALPTTMFVFAAMGVLITSASAIIYGEPIWDPVELVGKFTNPLVVAHRDVLGRRRDARRQHRRQRRVARERLRERAARSNISFKTGGLITGLIGIAMQPWRLLADPTGYIFTWLVGYSGGLGSIAGVLIADYWIVRADDARPRRSLPAGRRRYGRLEPGRRRRDARRLRARVGRARGPGAASRSTTTRGSSASSPRAACTSCSPWGGSHPRWPPHPPREVTPPARSVRMPA